MGDREPGCGIMGTMPESGPPGSAVTLCVLLWARPGAEAGLIAYEDQVLGIASGYGGRILQRARSSGADGQPLEVQILEFPSARAVGEFMADGRRQSLAGERERVIARTEVIDVQPVRPDPEPLKSLTAWLPRSCCKNCMNEATTSYERTGGAIGRVSAVTGAGWERTGTRSPAQAGRSRLRWRTTGTKSSR